MTDTAKDEVEFCGTERFVIERRLGAGGMGVVYQAYDRQRQDRVALKTLRFLEPSAIYRIKQEFRTLADVKHSNLVSLYELISQGEQWFFTMQLIDGVDFLTYVRGDSLLPAKPQQRRSSAAVDGETVTYVPESASTTETMVAHVGGKLQLARLPSVLRQLAEGVCALHRAGKLHRDIKPSNILVTADGRVMLLDFGLATDATDSQMHEDLHRLRVVGTAAYMSPEQAAGLPATTASDWYSIGVMLYVALTGRLPFTGSKSEVLRYKQMSDPAQPSELVEGIPAYLDQLTMDLLRRLPTERPSGAEVLRRLSGGMEQQPPPAEVAGPSSIPFVGRENQLRELHDAYRGLQRGRASIVFVHGRSGMGKSVLVERFLDHLRADDAVVLGGRCYEQESVPYKALDSLIDALSRYLMRLSSAQVEALLPRDVAPLARLFPVLRRVDSVVEAPRRASEIPDQQELRRRAFAALRELLARLGDRTRLVLFIDDLQWGDVDSANLIAELLRPPDPPVLLLLGCYRSEYASTSPCLRLLLEPSEKHGEQIERHELVVGPLANDEAYALSLQLLGSEGGSDPTVVAQAIARESRGHPYFVYELVRYVRTGSELSEHSSSAEGATLDQMVWSRVQRLPRAAYRLLEVVAVAAKPLKQADAYRAAQLLPAERDALALLRAEHFVRSTGPSEYDEVETYHDRIRETVVDRLPPAELKACHVRLALALEASPAADPEALAIHLQAAGEAPRAGHYYAIAADRAASALAFERAANLYRLAIELQSTDAGLRRSLRTRLADALANAGRGSEAAREYLEAAKGAPAAETLELQRRAAMQSLISGHIDDGLRALSTVLDAVHLTLPSTPLRALMSLLLRRARLRVRGLGYHERDTSQIAPATLTRIDICWSATVGLSIVDTIRGADFQARNLLLALAAGEPYRIARALAWEAAHSSTRGLPACRRTKRLIEDAHKLAQQIDHPHALGLVTLCRGIAGYMEGRWKEGRIYSEQAEEVFRNRCTGVAWELDTAHSFANWALFFLGEVSELRRRLPLLLQEARERGDLYAATNLGTFVGHLTWLAADDPDGGEQELREFMALWSQHGFHVQHLTGLMARVQIALYRGDAHAAWQAITNEWRALERSLFLRVQTVRIFMHDLRARSAIAAAIAARNAPQQRDPVHLLRAARYSVRCIEQERVRWSQPLAQRLRAAMAVVRGQQQEALMYLRQALEGFDATDMGLFAAATRRRLSLMVRGDEGRQLMEHATRCLNDQQVQDHGRMTALHLPGWSDL